MVNAADTPVRLDVESLRVFREVVTSDGFTAAADRLGMTQSAVSHKIKRLEERLGIELMRRDGSGFTVTADGHDLLSYADDLVNMHDAAVDHLQRSALTGQVLLGCNEEVAATALADVASRFRRTHPAVRLEIRVHDSAVVAGGLEDGAVDVALIQVLDVDDALRSTDEVWRRDDLHVVHGAAFDFDEAPSVPIISFGPHCLYEPSLIARLDEAGRRYHHAMECPSIHGVQAAVEAGLGVAVLNQPNLTEQMREWTAVEASALPQVAFVLRSATDRKPDLVEALHEHLTAALSNGAST